MNYSMSEHHGWLLDIFEGQNGGVVLWLLGEDGQRYRFDQSLPITFFAAAPNQRLRTLWRHLQEEYPLLKLERQERRDIFKPGLVPVLSIQAPNPIEQPGIFRRIAERFPDLEYYNADIPLTLRHAALFGTFPLAKCSIQAGADGHITQIHVLDTPWDLDVPPAPLRTLVIEPDCDPRHRSPTRLLLRMEGRTCQLPLEPARPLLVNLAGILKQYDPDLLLTAWGDGWLLPRLLEAARQHRITLPLNRESGRGVSQRAERTYFSYGQIIHRDQQIHTFGRWHVDIYNAILYHDYGMSGIYELGRVTALPIQTVARVSPGSGISAMQMVTALRHEILVPWHKQQAEYLKSVAQLMRSDQGGMVYQPISGLHSDVAELDFISMYPSIMTHCNISPETVSPRLEGEQPQESPGLIPLTLMPLLDKRLEIKRRLVRLSHWDPRRQIYKAQSSSHKWLLVTCFGYLGYKNARFGRIEAHEAVTSYGREALLRAKEAAEDMGFTVLHMYVDGLWVKKENATHPDNLEPLIQEIRRRTGLQIALEGIYRWVAFLPSRVNNRVSVPNRYFGVYQDHSTKARGVEFRRRDTSLWISEIQQALLERISQEDSAEGVIAILPELVDELRKQVKCLQKHAVPLEKLVMAQKMSRKLEEYRSTSPAAQAAGQLLKIGREMRPGQMLRFIHMTGHPAVHAWDLPDLPAAQRVDIEYYVKFMLRAASTLLSPFGISETDLQKWVLSAKRPAPAIPARPLRLFPLYIPRPPSDVYQSSQLAQNALTMREH
jgi:DNA polymerase-2